jgi:hypothetical protein
VALVNASFRGSTCQEIIHPALLRLKSLPFFPPSHFKVKIQINFFFSCSVFEKYSLQVFGEVKLTIVLFYSRFSQMLHR